MRRRAVALLTRAGTVAAAALLALAAAGCAGPGASPAGGPGGGAAAPADGAVADPARRAAADRRVERGRDLLEEGEARRAAAVLERALRIDPTHGEAYLVLARARIALGEEARAVGLLERAAELLRAEGSPAAARADSLRASLEGGG